MENLEIRKNDIRKHKKNKAIHTFKSVKYSKICFKVLQLNPSGLFYKLNLCTAAHFFPHCCLFSGQSKALSLAATQCCNSATIAIVFLQRCFIPLPSKMPPLSSSFQFLSFCGRFWFWCEKKKQIIKLHCQWCNFENQQDLGCSFTQGSSVGSPLMQRK